MKTTYQAVVYHGHGNPLEVCKPEQRELPSPGPGEIAVTVLAAPINPADLNTIEGKYPVRPESFPAIPGIEGVARVEQCGEGVSNVQAGDHVLIPSGLGSWREAACFDATRAIGIPREVPVEQAAMLKVNPPTAWRMIHDFQKLTPGDWIIQNASNSGVGRCVIQIAKALGLRTVNVVRRPELVDQLKALGGDEVLLEEEPIPDVKPKLGLNAVGGESALRISNALASGGTLVTYGAMGRQPVKVPNGLLIFKGLSFTGFWVSRWYRSAKPEEVQAMIQPLAEMAARGVLHTKVEKIYPVAECTAAIQRANEGGRDGKILFGTVA